jgi:sulfatase modifying factor 1
MSSSRSKHRVATVHSIIKTAFVAFALVAMTSFNLQAGALEPTNAPAPSMYTLEEIYLKMLSLEQKMNDLENRSPAMTLIPAGEFVMGNTLVGDGNSDELPIHTNTISAFYMDWYEVTKALWEEVKAHNGGNGYDYSYAGTDQPSNHPVHTVNWFDAVKWCNARSQMEGLTPVYYTDAGFTMVYKTGEEIAPFANWSANGYRLPTEAEWEKAARGGVAGQRFPWGDTISHDHANYYSSNSYDYDTSGANNYHPAFITGVFPNTSPVGYFSPNGYGLYDMVGNVSEWCWDWYQEDYYVSSPGSDPRGPAGPSLYRVLRGGSWTFDAFRMRVAVRNSTFPYVDNYGIGFRCVRGL